MNEPVTRTVNRFTISRKYYIIEPLIRNMVENIGILQVTTYEPLPGVVVAQDELLIFIALLILWATVGRWMYNDAKSRESTMAWQWAFGTPLAIIAGLDIMLLIIVIYLLLRDSE